MINDTVIIQDNPNRHLPFVMCDMVLLKDERVSQNALTTWIALLSFRNSVTGLCNPSVGKLAVRAKCSQSSVRRALSELRELGYLESIQGTDEHGGQRSNRYMLNDPLLVEDNAPPVTKNTPPCHDDTPPLSQRTPPPVTVNNKLY